MIAVLSLVFLASLVLALLVTPLVKRLASGFCRVDQPSDRKVHTRAIPRLGGIAIYISTVLPLIILLVYPNRILSGIFSDPSWIWIFLGASLVFLMGVADDVKRLPPSFKFVIQAISAFMAYLGGIEVQFFEFPWGTAYSFRFLALPVTVFWFLLVINAINLIDGLDGLAAGVSLFAGLTLTVLGIQSGHVGVALGLAALSGACLGFLRYNFNPASIFMGDGGSYFIGYMLASLSVLGSMKGQATVAILIPVIALGIPLIDTILAPIRRFILGNKLFQPDRNHIHHRLLALGFTHKKAVLVMYGATIFMGGFALLCVHAHDMYAGIVLFLLGICVFVGIRKLGYLEYIAIDKILGYFHDVCDEIGLKRDRRTFLNRQLAISNAATPAEMWNRVGDALQMLKVDFGEIQLNGTDFGFPKFSKLTWYNNPETHLTEDGYHTLSISLPLTNCKSYGILHLKKDLQKDAINHHTLRRIEHLRRSVVERLRRFEADAADRKRVGAKIIKPITGSEYRGSADPVPGIHKN